MSKASECNSKAEVRAEIDRLDHAIVKLFGERFSFVRRMAQLKRNPSEADDPDRVESVLTKIADEAAEQGLDPELMRAMWRLLIEWNIAYEQRSIGLDATDGGN